MEAYTVGKAIIEDAETGVTYEIDATELDWDLVSLSEEGMGRSALYEASVEHDELGRLTWSVTEYPVGVQDHTDFDFGGHRPIRNFSWGLRLSEEVPDDFGLDSLNPIPPAKRYHSLEDPIGVTARQLSRLPVTEQVPYLTYWFAGRYEDPANETPYNGREGGYLYVHGGPYHALEELEYEFAGAVSDRALGRAAEELESDGTFDWAPSYGHPDRIDEGREEFEELEEQRPETAFEEATRRLARGERPTFGAAGELEARRRIIRGLEEFAAELPPAAVEHGGRGHNQPPPDQRFTDEEIAEMRAATQTLVIELRKPEPELKTVVEKTSFFMEAIKWFGRKIDVAVDAAIQWGVPIGIVAVVGHAGPIISFVSQIGEWLKMLF